MKARKGNKDLRDFVKGYMTAALWISTDDSDDNLENNYGVEDIAPSSRRSMMRTCAKFVKANKADLASYCEHIVMRSKNGGTCMEYAGHDLWLTANDHGAGFWDRDGVGGSGVPHGPEGLGDRLTDASKKYASDMYVGDDGQIYVSPER